MAVQPVAALAGVPPEPVQVRARVAGVVVECVEDLAAGQLALEEPARAALRIELERLRRVAGAGLEVDGAAQRAASVPQRVAALVDLHVGGGQDLQRLEVGEPVRVPVGHPVDQHVDAAQVEVVAEPGASDRQLELVCGAEAGLRVDARREAQDIGEVRLPCAAELFVLDEVDGSGDLPHPGAHLVELAGAADGRQALHQDGRGGQDDAHGTRRRRAQRERPVPQAIDAQGVLARSGERQLERAVVTRAREGGARGDLGAGHGLALGIDDDSLEACFLAGQWGRQEVDPQQGAGGDCGRAGGAEHTMERRHGEPPIGTLDRAVAVGAACQEEESADQRVGGAFPQGREKGTIDARGRGRTGRKACADAGGAGRSVVTPGAGMDGAAPAWHWLMQVQGPCASEPGSASCSWPEPASGPWAGTEPASPAAAAPS